MKVALITETYPRQMGYLETGLPKHLAALGADVHVLATDLAPYHRWVGSHGDMPAFLKEQSFPAGSIETIDGYSVHILRAGSLFGYPFIRGLHQQLRRLRPDVIYVTAAAGCLPLQAALARIATGARLFTGNHTGANGFPAMRNPPRTFSIGNAKILLMRRLPGRLVSLLTEKCYCVTWDCGEVAWRFFGVQRKKVQIAHLGVDLTLFHPPESDADHEKRRQVRAKLGFTENEILCINTGKLTPAKMPQLLASAVRTLRAEGRPFRALFIGDGSERAALSTFDGSQTLGFMPAAELADYYRAADIAVWPATESISMLDAAACGTPLLVSDRIYQDHVTGNGYSYPEGDETALVEVLRRLQDPALRESLGRTGATKIATEFNWAEIAAARLEDFERAAGFTASAGNSGRA